MRAEEEKQIVKQQTKHLLEVGFRIASIGIKKAALIFKAAFFMKIIDEKIKLQELINYSCQCPILPNFSMRICMRLSGAISFISFKALMICDFKIEAAWL